MAEETILLQRPAEDVPWGFRLYGGRDFHCPLAVQKVTGGSIASTGLNAGDVILRIGETETGPLSHAQAMMAIKHSGNVLQLGISRSGAVTASMPSGTPTTIYSSPPFSAAVTPQTPPTGGVHFGANNQFGLEPQSQSTDYPFDASTGGGGGYYNGSQGMSSSYDGTESDLYGASTGNEDFSYHDSSRTPEVHTSGSNTTTSPPAHIVPDAVLNMAAKGPPDKKPFAYVTDVNDIRNQRDRVRNRNPATSLPRYQHMLNMPHFEEASPRRVRSTPPPPDRSAAGPSDAAVVANLQFNTPLGLYSGDNVVDALRGQTGGQIAGVVGLPQKDKGDITKSAVYKMIHGIDQPRPKPAVVHVESKSTPPPQHASDDETRFSGLQNRQTDIPSRSFQRLQSWTGNQGGSEIDTSSIRHNVAGNSGDGDQQPENYDEKSLRYTGQNIPSRSFRMLQQMTGGPDSPSSPALSGDENVKPSGLRSRSETPKRHLQPHQQQQHQRAHVSYQQPHYQQQEQQQQPPVNVGGSEVDTRSIRHNFSSDDDGQDVGQYEQKSIRYTGKNIPSRSFRMLQHLTGGDPGTPPVQHQSRTGRQQPQNHHPQQQQQQARRHMTPPEQGQHEGQHFGDDAASKDIRYAGGSIPSQSFRMLQQSVGIDNDAEAGQQPAAATDTPTTNGGGDMLQSTSLGRKVKVVRLRSQVSTEDTGATEF